MAGRRGGFFNTLSGRFLLLTVAFVMLAEVLIFVPSIARFRADFLTLRLEKAQIAALAQLAAEDMVTPALEKELLANLALLVARLQHRIEGDGTVERLARQAA